MLMHIKNILVCLGCYSRLLIAKGQFRLDYQFARPFCWWIHT